MYNFNVYTCANFASFFSGVPRPTQPPARGSTPPTPVGPPSRPPTYSRNVLIFSTATFRTLRRSPSPTLWKWPRYCLLLNNRTSSAGSPILRPWLLLLRRRKWNNPVKKLLPLLASWVATHIIRVSSKLPPPAHQAEGVAINFRTGQGWSPWASMWRGGGYRCRGSPPPLPPTTTTTSTSTILQSGLQVSSAVQPSASRSLQQPTSLGVLQPTSLSFPCLAVQTQASLPNTIQSVTLPASSLVGNQQILLPPVSSKIKPVFGSK